MPKISIAIPIHDTPKTASYLARMMDSIASQTFTDYEIVITKEGPFARNHNAAIMKAKGEIVQMMQMDDYFAHPHALSNIVKGFEDGAIWQISACAHHYEVGVVVRDVHIPYWTDDIYTGNNRLGSVSTLSFRRDKALLFEEPLTWLVDTDLYYRLFLKYGLPTLGKIPEVAIDTRNDRLSHTLPDQLKQEEINYLMKKYG